MPEDKKSTGRTGNQLPPTETQLATAKMNVDEFVQEIMPMALEYIKPEHAGSIVEEYEKIRGTTVSVGGMFAAMDVITPDMIGPTEAEWFRKISLCGRHVMNSILGRKLADTSDFNPRELAELAKTPHVLVCFSKLNRAVNAINGIFPPPSPGRQP